MTTGAPIYLVSACASGEEFVAAFRRYADRNGVVFVPIAEPLPAGKKARFALTLKDGGVMIDGEGEVVSSARTPSVMYGRVGMTVKFAVPDEPSKTVLAELEKARLALKPQPPSVAPRAADVPAEPRPTPPVPSGRVDAVNALAECVAIGDLGPPPERSKPPTIPPQIGAKFAVPAIPPRPASASVPPPLAGKPAAPLTPPRVPTPPAGTTLGMKPIDKAPAAPAPRQPTPPAGTTLGMKPIDKAPAAPAPRQPTPPAGTTLGMKPIDKAPAPPVVASTRDRDDATTPTPVRIAATKQREDDPTIPAPATPAPPIVAEPRPLLARDDDDDEPTDLTSIPIEGMEASVPVPVPAQPAGRESRRTSIGVAVVPEGVVVLPATPVAAAAADTAVVPAQPGPTSDEMTAAAPPPEPPASTVPAEKAATDEPPRPRSPAVQVEESTPSGDWTMTPGATGPTITPTPRAEKRKAPPGPPTGDWIVALDPSRPDGWSEPSKIEKRPAGELPPGPPVTEVSSAAPLDSNANVTPEPVVADAEPKVQIDPTLIEPLQEMPPLDDEAPPPGAPAPAPAPLPLAAADGAMSGSMPMVIATPAPGTIPPLMNAGAVPGVYVTPVPQPNPFASATGPNQAYPMDPAAPSALSGSYPRATSVSGDDARRKRMIVIGASAAAAVVIGIIALIVLGGGKDDGAKAASPVDTAPPEIEPTTAPDPATGSGAAAGGSSGSDTLDDSGSAQVEAPPPPDEPDTGTDDAGSAAVAVEPPPNTMDTPASGDCEVSITSAPSGAEIFLDKSTSLGTTPATVRLPCGVEAKLVFKRARYAVATRTITPSTSSRPLRVALARITFTVKVSSSPAGATIKVGSRSMGITPTTVRLPAYEASTLTISRSGYATDTHKITPKQNNQTVHVKLKKQTRRR